LLLLPAAVYSSDVAVSNSANDGIFGLAFTKYSFSHHRLSNLLQPVAQQHRSMFLLVTEARELNPPSLPCFPLNYPCLAAGPETGVIYD